MSFTINAKELRKSLKEIKAAEKNGFMYCEAVFRPVGNSLALIKLGYSDLWEKAHGTDGHYDWGRFQGISKRYRFNKKTKKLELIKE